MAGRFGVSVTDPPIRHALPQRQLDVDEALDHRIAARPVRSAMSPFFWIAAAQPVSA